MGHDDGNDGGGNPPFDPPRRPVNLECSVTDSMEVNCSSTVYGDRQQWRSSRAFVNEQIRRLRAQLMELKVLKKLLLYSTIDLICPTFNSLKEIRKHLKSNGPFTSGGRRQKEFFESQDAVSGEEESGSDMASSTAEGPWVIPPNSVECKCNMRSVSVRMYVQMARLHVSLHN